MMDGSRMAELSRAEWRAQGKPTRLAFSCQIQVASDYLRLTHALLDGTSLELECCEVSGANYTVTVCITTGKGRQYDEAAAILLAEHWFYEWLPIGTRVVFVSGDRMTAVAGR